MDEELTQQGKSSEGVADIKRQTITAVATRDGKLYNFGVISYYHSNPIRRAVISWFVQQRLKLLLMIWGFKHGNSSHERGQSDNNSST